MNPFVIEPLEARIAPATIAFSTPTVSHNQTTGATSYNFIVSIVGDDPNRADTITVDYATMDGSSANPAHAGTDYQQTMGTLQFFGTTDDAGATVTTLTVTVPVNGEAPGTPDKDFFVNLSNVQDVASSPMSTVPTLDTSGAATAHGFLLNVDQHLTFSSPTVSVAEGNGGSGVTPNMATVTVSLAQAVTHDVTIHYSTLDALSDPMNLTAIGLSGQAGQDFVGTNDSTVTITAGQTSALISVPIIGDTNYGPDETFKIHLLGTTLGATVDANTDSTVTIQNDDGTGPNGPSFTVTGPTGVVAKGSDAVFHISDGVGYDYPVTVNYTLHDGSAVHGVNYTPPSSMMVTIPAGSTGVDVHVPTINPGNHSDPQLNFTLTLDSGSAASASQVVAGVTIPAENPGHEGTVDTTAATATIAGLVDDGLGIRLHPVTVMEGNGGDSTALFSVTVDHPVPAGQTLTIFYHTEGGNATPGPDTAAGSFGDYTPILAANASATPPIAGTSITLTAGQSAAFIPVTVHGDTLVEGGDETFNLVADYATYGSSSSLHDTIITTKTAVGTIKNDDPLTTKLSVTPVQTSQFEGDGNPGPTNTVNGNASFVVHLSNPLSHALVVDYTVSGGAVTGNQMVTIPAGALSATFTVPYAADDAATPANPGPVQADHDLVVTLADPMTETANMSPDVLSKLVVLDTTNNTPHNVATTHILDDDTIVSVMGGTVAEGAAGTHNSLPFTFSIPAAVKHDIIVTYSTVDGTATSTGAQADYAAQTNQTVTIKAGMTSAVANVVVNGDNMPGLDETVMVKMSSVSGGAIGSTTDPNTHAVTINDTATGTIMNDDGAIAPKVTIANATGTEGGNANFTVTLDQAYEVPVTITYSLADAAAGPGVHPTSGSLDYTVPSPGSASITIAAGATTGTIGVPLLSDGLAETAETFNVSLLNVTVPTSDMAHPTMTTAATATTGGQLTALGTIAASDRPNLTVTGVTQNEGNADGIAEFHLNLSAALNHDLYLLVNTANGTAIADAGGTMHDYVGLTSMEVKIPAGQTSAVVDVTTHGNTISEADKSFMLNVGIETGMGTGLLLADTDSDTKLATSSATAKLLNDDSTFSIVSDQATVKADGTMPLAKFTITRTDATVAATVQYSATTTDLTLPANFHLPTNQTVSFAPGVTSMDIFVPVLAETSFQAVGHITTTLSNPTNGIVDSTHTSDLVTVNSINAPLVSISSPQTAIGEGNSGSLKPLTFTVHLNEVNSVNDTVVQYNIENMLPAGVTVPKGTGNAPASLVGSTSGTVTIPKGQTSATFTVNVVGNNARNQFPEEAFFVHLAGTTNTDGTQINPNTVADYGVGLIIDDDPIPVVSIGSALVSKSANAQAETFTVSLSNPSDVAINVPYHIVSGTAKLGTDFNGNASGTVMIAAGQTSGTITLAVPGFDMNVPAAGSPDQTFQVVLDGKTLTDAKLNPAASVGTGVIRDDTAVAIAINSLSLLEGNLDANGKSIPSTAAFTVSLTNPSTVPVTVHYTTVDGTATADAGGHINDYVPVSGTLTFAPGVTSQTINVAVHGDNQDESNESFTVVLSDAKNGTIISATGAANSVGIGTGTIMNDDSTPTVNLADVHVIEGSSSTTPATLVFTPTIVGVSTSPVTFTISTGNIPGGLHNATAGPSATSNGADYVSKTQSFTIPAGAATNGTFSVTVIGDTVFETAENLQVNITNISSNAVGGKTSAIGTIINDDVFFSAHEVKWTDPGGQIGDFKISRGTLSPNNFEFTPDTTNGGDTLTLVDLEAQSFLRTNITVTATRDPGLPAGLGTVGDVLQIGGIRSNNTQSVSNVNVAGVDLGVINIQGNLDSIIAGDSFNDLGITSLHVKSFGAQNTAANPSAVIAGIGTFKVDGNFTGDLSVVGNQYGTIGNLIIGGGLESLSTVAHETNADGSAVTDASGNQVFPATGIISTTAGITSATIGFIGNPTATLGDNSASLLAGSIGTLHVKGDITGGAGNATGAVFSAAGIHSVVIDGSINLGTGAKFTTDSTTHALTTTPTDTASIIANTTISAIHVAGSIVGGNIAAGTSIGKVQVDGNLSYSGASTNNPATISAGGFQQTANSILEVVALPSVLVKGNVSGGRILAGYSTQNLALNADARIGTVQVNGNVMDLDIVAGVSTGSDAFYGDKTDLVIQASSTVGSVLDSPSVVSDIAKVIINGSILASSAGTHHGIVAQNVNSLVIAGVSKTLVKSFEYAQIGANTNFFIADIPVSDPTSSRTPDQIDA